MSNVLPKHRAREYETIFILNPASDTNVIDKVAARCQEVISRLEGKLLRAENWGNRRLAYPVKKNPKGIYIYLRYLGYQTLVHELERNLRMLDTVIKYLTIKVDEDVDPEARPVHKEEISFVPRNEEPEPYVAKTEEVAPVKEPEPDVAKTKEVAPVKEPEPDVAKTKEVAPVKEPEPDVAKTKEVAPVKEPEPDVAETKEVAPVKEPEPDVAKTEEVAPAKEPEPDVAETKEVAPVKEPEPDVAKTEEKDNDEPTEQDSADEDSK